VPLSELPDPQEHVKEGMNVLVIGRTAKETDHLTHIVTVGRYESIWLPAGQTRWGATIAIASPTGEIIESEPMLASQFRYDKDTRQWLLLLV
jgi:hypothetical protein